MKTMITGAHGFLGSELRTHYPDAICETRELYDLTIWEKTRALVNLYRPHTLIHLAAEVGGIGANRANPGRFFYANLQMGLNVLEACRVYGVQKLVMVGTVCAYPKLTPVPFQESFLWGGYPEETNAPYGIAKRALLTGCQAYRAQYGLDAIYLLPVNLYGPGDNFDPELSHVIPAMVKKMVDAVEEGKKLITLWGDGSPTREFLHVSDAARAIMLADKYYSGPEPVNVGSGEEISIFMLAQMVATEVGFQGKIVWDEGMPNGQPRRVLDVSRARDLFGFEASIPFQQGLHETCAWYQQKRAESYAKPTA